MATKREPFSVSYEHQPIFFPDTGCGTASTAGFGLWGGSGDEAPISAFGLPHVFLHAWLSDTQKNPHFRRNVCVIKVRICVRKLAENFGDCAVFEYAAFSIVSPDEGFKVA
jgi:hypothetical protein